MALCLAFAILFGHWPREVAALDAADESALAALDGTWRTLVDANAPAEDRDGAFGLVRSVIDRVNRSHLHAFSIRELAHYAEEGMRKRTATLEPGKVPPADLAEHAVEAMLAWLSDPYASYSARRMRARGNRLGDIGIETTVEGGRVKVIAPLEGGPAHEAGIMAGDFILEVDHVSVSGMSVAQVMERVRGPLGSLAVLHIRRGRKPAFDLSVPRTKFQVLSLRHQMFDRLVYIRIAFFGPQTESLLRQSLAESRTRLGDDEPVGYIVDLRDNPGGLVGQAILLADAFLDQGMIVATRGRDDTGSQTYNAYKGDFFNGRPIVVLINRASASASEILAAALRDNDRAILLGDRSYGKGVVQTNYPFGAWGQIRITTHKYMTASGKQIEELGVRPHIWIGDALQPQYDGETIDASRCPAAGPARDRLLGCAILLLHNGGTADSLKKALAP